MEATTLSLTIDAAQRDFLYRKGTVDEAAVVHALVNSGYGIGALRRAADLANLYERILRAGKAPLIIDAAANIGAAAVFFGHKYPKAKIVAIEADRANYDLLVANTDGLPVECLRAALSATANDADFVTVNELYALHADRTPFVLKVDAETQGRMLFTGNLEWVARTPVIIVALNDCLVPGTPNSRACVDYITGCNRDFAYLNDSVFSVDRDLLNRRFNS